MFSFSSCSPTPLLLISLPYSPPRCSAHKTLVPVLLDLATRVLFRPSFPSPTCPSFSLAAQHRLSSLSSGSGLHDSPSALIILAAHLPLIQLSPAQSRASPENLLRGARSDGILHGPPSAAACDRTRLLYTLQPAPVVGSKTPSCAQRSRLHSLTVHTPPHGALRPSST